MYEKIDVKTVGVFFLKNNTVITVMSVSADTKTGSGYLRRVIKMNELILKKNSVPLIIAPWKFKEKISERVQGIKLIRVPRLTIPGVHIPIWDDFFSYSLILFIILFVLSIFKNVKLIHAHNPPDTPAFVSIIIGKIFRFPVIYDVHDFWIYLTQINRDYYWHPHSIQNKLGRIIEWFCLTHATTIFVVSWTMKQILNARKIPARKIYIIRQPCDLSLFDPTKHNGRLIKQNYYLEKHRPIITYIGKIESFRRGLEVLVRSMKIINKKYSDAVLVIVGNTNSSIELKNLARKIGILDSSIIFIGWVSSNLVPEFIAASDILVAPFLDTPDINIAAPHKIYEYMAMEKPIVITATSEFKHMLNNSAFFVKPGDVKDLAQTIIQAYEDTNLAQIYAQKARALLVEKYSWRFTSKKLRRIYGKFLT